MGRVPGGSRHAGTSFYLALIIALFWKITALYTSIYIIILYTYTIVGVDRRRRRLSRKRGNGEGTIHRRKGGGWCAQYSFYTAAGRKRKTLYGKTRAEVATKLTKALSDREGGMSLDTANLKLGEYLERWLRDSVRDSVRDITYQGYERLVRNHITPTLGASNSRPLRPHR
jgi:hypothetical protein